MIPAGGKPVILAVDDDPTALGHVSVELQRRYDRDYRILFEVSPQGALARLEALRNAGERVAVVLADQWMPELTGTELLARVHELHSHAKRALMLSWGDWGDAPTVDAIRSAMRAGHIDAYVVKPWSRRTSSSTRRFRSSSTSGPG